jgi:nitronate monooxygenase
VALPDILARDLAVPVVASPLFIVSRPELVIAQCCAGVVGSFPALNARPKEKLEAWLAQIEAARATFAAKTGRSAAPYAVNQIVHRTNPRIDHDLDVCERFRVPIVVTSLGAREDVNRRVQSWGGIVLHDVISAEQAQKALDKGADGIIAVAAGAGGHAGRLSPFALVAEIRRFFAGPLILAGSIATGGGVAAARAMGADLAYVGTPFLATTESAAAPDYKQMIVEGRSADIVLSDYFSGVPANFLKRSVARAGFDPDRLPSSTGIKLDFGKAADDAPTAWRDIWSAGQGIGAIDAVVPVAELVARLAAEYRAACARLA